MSTVNTLDDRIPKLLVQNDIGYALCQRHL